MIATLIKSLIRIYQSFQIVWWLENQKIELLQDIVRNTDFKEDLDKLSKEINMLKKDKEELESEITSLKKQIEDSNKSQKENNGADGT